MGMLAVSDIVYPFSVGFAVALAGSLAIGFTRRWHGAFSYDSTAGPQKFHEAPTPRIGGLAVYAGFWAASAMVPPPMRGALFALGAAASLTFLAGAFEDVTKNGRVAPRLIAPILSGAAFCLATGYAIGRAQVPYLDQALAVPAVAIALTALAMAAVSHALNIVDGFNGLAAGTAIIAAIAFSGVALGAGDSDMALCCFVFAGVMLGFLVANFPGGRVFLGDGGAYFTGFALAAMAVMLAARNPGVSPWVGAVVLAYPLLEVAFSVVRKLRRGRQPHRPDGLHLHMLVYRRYGKRIARAAGNDRIANPATGALMWTGAGAGLALALALPPERDWALAALAALACLYALAYRAAARFRGG